MQAFFRIGTTLMAIVLLLITIAACGQTPGSAASQPAASKLTREQAMAIAENALEAYNNGNYAAWSRDWSDTMKNGIKETDFRSFRDELLRSKGTRHYPSCGLVTGVADCTTPSRPAARDALALRP